MLSPLKTKIKYRNIFAFDIETHGDNNDFILGSIYGVYKKYRKDRNKIYDVIIDKVFMDKLEFCNYIINNSMFYENSYIVATNLGFDLLGLFAKTDFLPNINLIIRGSNIIYATIKHENKKKTIKFIDSYNFCKFSVKKMGELIGLEKLPQPICFKKLPRDNTELQELINYNKRDTRITYEYMRFLQKGFNDLNCNLKITIASTSMDLFKRNFLKTVLNQNKGHLDVLFKGYYGARTEILKRGYVQNLKYYDYNSLYPSVMLNKYPHPNYEKYTSKCSLSYLKNKSYHGVVKAKVYIKDIDIPYLPYRMKLNNTSYKLIFPKGCFTGYYTFYELRKAIEYGYKILDLGEAVYYTKIFKPFEDFIKMLYKKRLHYKEIKSILEIVTKILMNSLYGKFAQKITGKESIYHLQTLAYEELKKYTESDKYKSIIRGDYIYVKTLINDYIPSFVIPIFSIYTTSYGRTKLYELIKKVGLEHTYYYDTDSIITDKILESSQELGKLKLEYFIRDGVLIAPKMYAFITDNKEVIKVKGASKVDTYNKFENIMQTKKYSYEKFVKFKEANNRNLNYNQILLVEKNFSMEDNKRIWKEKFNPEILQTSNSITITE